VASPACAEVEADRALSGLTCLNRLFRLIQMLELSRFLWWLQRIVVKEFVVVAWCGFPTMSHAIP